MQSSGERRETPGTESLFDCLCIVYIVSTFRLAQNRPVLSIAMASLRCVHACGARRWLPRVGGQRRVAAWRTVPLQRPLASFHTVGRDDSDTIVALSSAPGKAAVSIVRVSGRGTRGVVDKCTHAWSKARRGGGDSGGPASAAALPARKCVGGIVQEAVRVLVPCSRVSRCVCRAVRRLVVNPSTGEEIDDALVLFFPSPARYAG